MYGGEDGNVGNIWYEIFDIFFWVFCYFVNFGFFDVFLVGVFIDVREFNFGVFGVGYVYFVVDLFGWCCIGYGKVVKN